MDSYEDMQVTPIWADPEATTQTQFPFPVSKDVQAASRRIRCEPSIDINGSTIRIECYPISPVLAVGLTLEETIRKRRKTTTTAPEKSNTRTTDRDPRSTTSSGSGGMPIPFSSNYRDSDHEGTRFRILIGRLVPCGALNKCKVDWVLYVDTTDAHIGLMSDPNSEEVCGRWINSRQGPLPGVLVPVREAQLNSDVNTGISYITGLDERSPCIGQVLIQHDPDDSDTGEIIINWEDAFKADEAGWQYLYYKLLCLRRKENAYHVDMRESALLREMLPQPIKRLQFMYRFHNGFGWQPRHFEGKYYLDDLRELTEYEHRVLSAEWDFHQDLKLVVQLDRVRIRSNDQGYIGESFASTFGDPSYAVIALRNPPALLETAAYSARSRARESRHSCIATGHVDPGCLVEPIVLCISWRRDHADNDISMRISVSICGRLSYKKKPTDYMLLKLQGKNEFFALGTGSERPWESVEDDYDKISGEQRYRTADGECFYHEDDWCNDEEVPSICSASPSYDHCDITPTVVVRSRLYHLPNFPDCVQFQLQHVGELRLKYLSTVVEMRENSAKERVLADQAMSV